MNEIYYQKPPTVTRKDTIYSDRCPVFEYFSKTKHYLTLNTTFLGKPARYWGNQILNLCLKPPLKYDAKISFQKYHE